MIKISALNEESEEDSGSEEEVTREASEQIALQQYANALELQRKGNLKEATQLLRDLLDTELLYEVQKPAQGEKVPGPLFNLKYLSYKNLAAMLTASDEVDAAIEAYCAAAELDDTDVTLWHRLGQLCMRTKRYEMALHAFQRGAERNPRHWPCLDKIVTLLLGLDYKEECISTIHDTLQLDPGYLRGLAYRKHIYTVYPYIKDFMEYLNPIYKWDEKDDEPFDEDKAKKLINEAEIIHDTFIEQQRAEQFKYVLPELKLVKPVSSLSWKSVGDSLVHMHHYMSENCYSHACKIEMVFEKEDKQEPMELCEEPVEVEQNPEENKVEEAVVEPEKNVENVSENENNDLSDKDKTATDTEKVESDVEMTTENVENPADNKQQKKAPVRRRGSALSFLEMWEWCTKRRSGRKKPTNKQEQDDNIYETLRRMVPISLVPELVEKKENQARETSPDVSDLDKLFEAKDKPEEPEITYFGSEDEQKDVKNFINQYTEQKKDIIDILNDFLNILAYKWREKWPKGLSEVFIEANKCYLNHIDIPTCTSDNDDELLHFTTVNILAEEFLVNEKLNKSPEEEEKHELSMIETVGIILSLKPNIFKTTDCLDFTLRYLWVKLHIHLFNKCNEFALDCLYQLVYEFEAMGEHHDTYNLDIVNFIHKPKINESEVLAAIKDLERNEKLSTVMELYDKGNYEEVLSIVIESFEHCKTMAKVEEQVALDFAVHLAVILDTYWALDRPEECFKWSLICLHEALNHYFRFTTGSQDYDKWTLTVVKILCCMDHILTTEGLTCLDTVSQKELSQGLEDLIRIIGHQVETNAPEMPFGTVIPWIIVHYILQREEDQGRARIDNDKAASDEDVPNPLMVLFIAHEQLGKRGWCCKSEGKLLYFTLDTVVPRLRSPSLAKSLEQVVQYMEQCVFCLFGHPGRKNKLKYLVDHNVPPYTLDWKRAQQVYEIFRPPTLPALEGKLPGITADTEQLFHKILALLPPECDPQKYLPDIERYIKGLDDKMPHAPSLLPYKMKDIYFLLGDYYYKREESKLGIKFNMLDVALNNDRVESWARISLAKSVNLERMLNSCKNLNHEREFLNPAKSVIRCYKRCMELDPTYCNMWTEYGMFAYCVHSFCSRVLKQASESLSMEDFESLEKLKEDMLDITHNSFITVQNELNNSSESDKINDESWLHFYMLGKVSEKRNKPPSVYLDYYMNAVKSLQESNATYPSKINYNTPTHLCVEVLELHYRIHASILKYIEQHESKPIPASVGKVFSTCIEEWKKGPFTRKPKKDGAVDMETNTEPKPAEPVHAANILKRSISDAGEEESHEAKRLKMEAAAAKVRRSASYDTERKSKEPIKQSLEVNEAKTIDTMEEKKQEVATENLPQTTLLPPPPPTEPTKEVTPEIEKPIEEKKDETDGEKKEDSSSSTSSSSSSSDSSSSETSSDSSSDSTTDSDESKSSNDAKPMVDDEIMKIVSACLDALEDCASRFPPHYKAIYRLAHYHFYYKKGKDIERCRDLMLSNFTSRSGHKMGGLFSERKPSNFFNNIWRIPIAEVDRPGSFTLHMNRAVLLTMEILKEIDDHKTLLELSIVLQKIPELDKKYVRDSDREELSQQAFSLCVQSLKGQLIKFSQQADLKINEVERQALNSFMLDIYRAYLKVQKQPNAKQFTNLIVEGYKLLRNDPIPENINVVDLSLKYCHKMLHKIKSDAMMASVDKSQNAQKKQAAKAAVGETSKAPAPSVSRVENLPKPEQKAPPPSTSTASSSLPKMSPHEMAAAFQSYLPMLNDPVLSQQTAAALSLSYLSNMSVFGAYPSLQNTLQNTLQNSFQAEFYRQFLGQSFPSFMPPAKKQKRGPKPGSVRSTNPQMKTSKSFTAPTMPSTSKAIPTPVISSLQKSNSTPMTPSMGSVLQNLPASMSANLSSFSTHSSSHSTHSMPAQAHMSTASTVNAAIHTKPPLPHQQVSPGKTLQEKLAERQKHLPISKNHEINASISKLPSSLTITKTSVPKPAPKKPEAKKQLPFTERPKPITSDEVIVLDDD